MPSAAAGYRVAVLARPDDPTVLAEQLARAEHISRTDARIQARAAPGVLPGLLTDEQAAAIVAALAEIGLPAVALPDTDLPHTTRAHVVHHPRLTPQGLEILDLRGDLELTVPWLDVAVAALGEVPEDVVHRSPGESRSLLSSGPYLDAGTMEGRTNHGPELWLLGRDPALVLRLDHRRLNYECLGDRKSTSATANFRAFAQQLFDRLPHVHRTPSTQAWLMHQPRMHFEFASSAALEHDAIFHWVLSRRDEHPVVG